MNRRLEVTLMLQRLRELAHRTRTHIGAEHGPEVTSRIWRAEMELQKASEAVERSSPIPPVSEPPEATEGPLTPS